MTYALADQHFRSYEEVKNWIDLWIASKDYTDGLYFESSIYNQFFTIKPRISEKTADTKLYTYYIYIIMSNIRRKYRPKGRYIVEGSPALYRV